MIINFLKHSLDTKNNFFFFLVSEATIEVCTKIYKKSRSAISTAAEKRRSIKCEKSTVSFTSEERRHLKISDPKSPAMYYF